MTNIPANQLRELADGTSIPLLGLGVWQIPNGQECVDAVKWALAAGYRHIDTAQLYKNEEAVGQGLRESGIRRDEVYVTTKFNPSSKDPMAELEQSLKRLGLDFVDLYLVHWPKNDALWPWAAMERAHESGLTRSIGVSNYGVDDLAELREAASVQPVVNQVQFGPFAYRKELLEVCNSTGVALESYSTLGTGRYVGDATVARIAESYGRTPAQVLLRWCVQLGVPVIPKSTHRERIVENGRLFDFELSADDMAALDALDRTGGTGRALDR